MEELIELSEQKINRVPLEFVRGIMEKINWKARLIGIKGAKGIGKTTLLLQYIKLHLSKERDKVLYVSLDNLWFANNSLVGLAREFDQKGGKYLFLDEVHKYNGWAQELKNIYDDYPDLKVIFTGSSLLEILNARADLSRRAVVYHMQGLSFREYLALETGAHFEPISLEEILLTHTDKARKVNEKIKPFQYFGNYLRYGYYPFYREENELFPMRLEGILNLMLDIELPLLRQVEPAYVVKIKQLLSIIAESVPFVPNVSKLGEKIGINRNTLLAYLHYLDEIGLTRNLFRETKGTSLLQKPSKIYLENTNLIYLLARENANQGNLRETFFANQAGYAHSIYYAEKGDFVVDEKLIFEVGGRGKTQHQIKDLENAFIAAGDLTFGMGNKIPLWLFGFLY